MIGNDVREDMIAQQLGMKVFLLTDCLINNNNIDISIYPTVTLNSYLIILKHYKKRTHRSFLLD
jgi:hypothetical protein